MNKLGKNVLVAIAAVLSLVGLTAQGCDGPKPSGLILSIDRPPLAQTLGCKEGLWRLSVVSNAVADDPQLTPDQKAAKAQRVCLKPQEADRYTVGGQYP